MRGLFKTRTKKKWSFGVLILLVAFTLLMLFAGIYAVTQESDEGDETFQPDPESNNNPQEVQAEDDETESLPIWLPPGPPRWYLSNRGGVAIEEIPSRLAALRNKYALVIDYVPPYEIEPYLINYYKDGYLIEIRILYADKEVDRIQWILRDENGVTRVNAVKRLSQETEKEPEPEKAAIEDKEDQEDKEEAVLSEDAASEDQIAVTEEDEDESKDIAEKTIPDEIKETAIKVPFDFIEFFNSDAQLTSDSQFLEDGSEMTINYYYNMGFLIKSETVNNKNILYTDTYRYNRSYSLRSVERVFHDSVEAQPVRENFASRILDAALDMNFIGEKPQLASEFLGSYNAEENFKLLSDVDSRGRVITQKMLDDEDEIIWIIENTWVGDRISATKRTEGDEIKLIEYEYDTDGNRIVMREINNGVLERLVLSEGNKETEELYLDGLVVLRAFWEDGRKISEERTRGAR